MARIFVTGSADGLGLGAARALLDDRQETADGLERHFAVNMLAPYLLTALITRPDRPPATTRRPT
jgi:hypothetical protein